MSSPRSHSRQLNSATAALQPAVFTRLLPTIQAMAEKPIPLHIGDTFLPPPTAARLDRVAATLADRTYAYSAPNGLPSLRAAFCERWTGLGKANLDVNRVHVTVGATGGVFAALQAFVSPGDEVLLLSPFWPLVRGMIVALGATPVEVPFYLDLDDEHGVTDLLAPHITPRTTAIYICSPNNPSGIVLPPAQCSDLAAFCVHNDLWVISDEAYVDYAFAPHRHQFMADLPGMGERTASVYTASKSYALAGIRVGFLVGDPSWLETARRATTHSVYNVAEISQLSAQAAIINGEDWVRQAKEIYRAGASVVAERLQASFVPAAGAGYVFVDLREELGPRPLLDYLTELLHEGVSLCPGAAFGQHWPHHVRLCYMSVPADRLTEAVNRLNRSFERLRGRPWTPTARATD